MAAPQVVAPASTPPAPDAASPAATTAPLEREARALLGAWEKAQNEGALPDYDALYAARFTGVRRSGPRRRNFDRASWLRDRSRMFASPMKVHFEPHALTTQGDRLIVTGEQSFEQGSYQDRGAKRFVLAREAGAVRIAREEMLSSDLGPPPSTKARFVTGIEGGPTFVLLGAAEPGAEHGPLLSANAEWYFGVASYAPGAAAEARFQHSAAGFLEGPVQLVSARGACTTQSAGLRFVRVAYAHMYEGAELGDGAQPAPPPATPATIARELGNVDPRGFWAVELRERCITDPLVAVPGDQAVVVYARSELNDRERAAQRKRFAAAAFMRRYGAAERADMLASLESTRFAHGGESLVFSQVSAGCSTPFAAALYDEAHAHSLVFDGEGGGLERADAVADLDGDGVAEIIGGASIGISPLVIRDVKGNEALRLDIPFVLCPC